MFTADMWKITVVKNKETPNEWVFAVTVLKGIQNDRIYYYDVIVEKEYYKQLTRRVISPVSLVEHSFLFLLGKESPESILESFNLKEIKSHFSDYEEKMGTRK